MFYSCLCILIQINAQSWNRPTLWGNYLSFKLKLFFSFYFFYTISESKCVLGLGTSDKRFFGFGLFMGTVEKKNIIKWCQPHLYLSLQGHKRDKGIIGNALNDNLMQHIYIDIFILSDGKKRCVFIILLWGTFTQVFQLCDT